jgi:hypothetical protein
VSAGYFQQDAAERLELPSRCANGDVNLNKYVKNRQQPGRDAPEGPAAEYRATTIWRAERRFRPRCRWE